MGRTNKAEDEEKKAAYGCELAPPLPEGVTLSDVRDVTWCLGKSVGSGAFGDVYLAGQGKKTPNAQNAKFVAKLEPHANGPLFTEMHFLVRVGLPEHRNGWSKRKEYPVGYVGMPCCHGFGSFVYEEQKLRFVIIDRLGSDLDKFFKGGEKPFPLVTSLRVAVQVLDALEFIHSKNYVHNDIKAQNLLLGHSGEHADKVFLVDFGLACKYRNGSGFHKPHEPDERRAHEGTLEYTSLDAHIGAHSRRGDLETLAYNLVHWTSGNLPWLKDMNHDVPEAVENQKKLYMANIPGFLSRCFQPDESPKILEDFLVYVSQMEFDTAPDYDHIRSKFVKCINGLGKGSDGKLMFNKPVIKRKVSKRTRRTGQEDDNARTGFDEELSQGFEDFTIDENSRGGEESMTRRTRSMIDDGTHDTWNWEDVLKKNPESIARENKEEDEDKDKAAREEDFNRCQLETLSNPTPEMCRIIASIMDIEEERRAMMLKDQLAEFNKQRKAELLARFSSMDLEPQENTPAMEEIVAKRNERMSKNLPSPGETTYVSKNESPEFLQMMEKVKKYVRKVKKEKFPTTSNRPTTRENAGKAGKGKKNLKNAKKKPASEAQKTKQKTAAASVGEAVLSGALAKVTLSTRSKAKGSPKELPPISKTRTLRVSQQLLKKAVERSKEIKNKVSPILRSRQARTRSKAAKAAEEKKEEVPSDEEAASATPDDAERGKEEADDEEDESDDAESETETEKAEAETENEKGKSRMDKRKTRKKDSNVADQSTSAPVKKGALPPRKNKKISKKSLNVGQVNVRSSLRRRVPSKKYSTQEVAKVAIGEAKEKNVDENLIEEGDIDEDALEKDDASTNIEEPKLLPSDTVCIPKGVAEDHITDEFREDDHSDENSEKIKDNSSSQIEPEDLGDPQGISISKNNESISSDKDQTSPAPCSPTNIGHPVNMKSVPDSHVPSSKGDSGKEGGDKSDPKSKSSHEDASSDAEDDVADDQNDDADNDVVDEEQDQEKSRNSCKDTENPSPVKDLFDKIFESSKPEKLTKARTPNLIEGANASLEDIYMQRAVSMPESDLAPSAPVHLPLNIDTTAQPSTIQPMFSPDTEQINPGAALMDSDSESSGLDPTAFDRILSVLSPESDSENRTEVPLADAGVIQDSHPSDLLGNFDDVPSPKMEQSQSDIAVPQVNFDSVSQLESPSLQVTKSMSQEPVEPQLQPQQESVSQEQSRCDTDQLSPSQMDTQPPPTDCLDLEARSDSAQPPENSLVPEDSAPQLSEDHHDKEELLSSIPQISEPSNLQSEEQSHISQAGAPDDIQRSSTEEPCQSHHHGANSNDSLMIKNPENFQSEKGNTTVTIGDSKKEGSLGLTCVVSADSKNNASLFDQNSIIKSHEVQNVQQHPSPDARTTQHSVADECEQAKAVDKPNSGIQITIKTSSKDPARSYVITDKEPSSSLSVDKARDSDSRLGYDSQNATCSVRTTSTSAGIPSLKISIGSPNIKDIDSPQTAQHTITPSATATTPILKIKRQKSSKKSRQSASPPSQEKNCEHFVDRESQENLDDFKALSRSFSSIKQRLKTLAKDLCKPLNSDPEVADTPSGPLTLKIIKTEDGQWQATPSPRAISTSLPGSKRIDLTPLAAPVNSGDSKTERVRKRGRRGRRTVANAFRSDSTAGSNFKPEGWVSFEEVQAKLKSSGDDTSKDVSLDEVKVDVKRSPVPHASPPKVEATTPVKPTTPLLKVRSDLFAVKKEEPAVPVVKSEPSILKDKLLSGRRNVANSSRANESLPASNKLIVLNPVTEELPDFSQSRRILDPQAKSCYCCPTLHCQFRQNNLSSPNFTGNIGRQNLHNLKEQLQSIYSNPHRYDAMLRSIDQFSGLSKNIISNLTKGSMNKAFINEKQNEIAQTSLGNSQYLKSLQSESSNTDSQSFDTSRSCANSLSLLNHNLSLSIEPPEETLPQQLLDGFDNDPSHISVSETLSSLDEIEPLLESFSSENANSQIVDYQASSQGPTAHQPEDFDRAVSEETQPKAQDGSSLQNNFPSIDDTDLISVDANMGLNTHNQLSSQASDNFIADDSAVTALAKSIESECAEVEKQCDRSLSSPCLQPPGDQIPEDSTILDDIQQMPTKENVEVQPSSLHDVGSEVEQVLTGQDSTPQSVQESSHEKVDLGKDDSNQLPVFNKERDLDTPTMEVEAIENEFSCANDNTSVQSSPNYVDAQFPTMDVDKANQMQPPSGDSHLDTSDTVPNLPPNPNSLGATSCNDKASSPGACVVQDAVSDPSAKRPSNKDYFDSGTEVRLVNYVADENASQAALSKDLNIKSSGIDSSSVSMDALHTSRSGKEDTPMKSNSSASSHLRAEAESVSELVFGQEEKRLPGDSSIEKPQDDVTLAHSSLPSETLEVSTDRHARHLQIEETSSQPDEDHENESNRSCIPVGTQCDNQDESQQSSCYVKSGEGDSKDSDSPGDPITDDLCSSEPATTISDPSVRQESKELAEILSDVSAIESSEAVQKSTAEDLPLPTVDVENLQQMADGPNEDIHTSQDVDDNYQRDACSNLDSISNDTALDAHLQGGSTTSIECHTNLRQDANISSGLSGGESKEEQLKNSPKIDEDLELSSSNVLKVSSFLEKCSSPTENTPKNSTSICISASEQSIVNIFSETSAALVSPVSKSEDEVGNKNAEDSPRDSLPGDPPSSIQNPLEKMDAPAETLSEPSPGSKLPALRIRHSSSVDFVDDNSVLSVIVDKPNERNQSERLLPAIDSVEESLRATSSKDVVEADNENDFTPMDVNEHKPEEEDVRTESMEVTGPGIVPELADEIALEGGAETPPPAKTVQPKKRKASEVWVDVVHAKKVVTEASMHSSHRDELSCPIDSDSLDDSIHEPNSHTSQAMSSQVLKKEASPLKTNVAPAEIASQGPMKKLKKEKFVTSPLKKKSQIAPKEEGKGGEAPNPIVEPAESKASPLKKKKALSLKTTGKLSKSKKSLAKSSSSNTLRGSTSKKAKAPKTTDDLLASAGEVKPSKKKPQAPVTFKKPKLDNNISERRSSTEQKKQEKQRRDSTSSVSSDISVASGRSRHESSSSNASESSCSKERPKSRNRILEGLDSPQILSRRHARKCANKGADKEKTRNSKLKIDKVAKKVSANVDPLIEPSDGQSSGNPKTMLKNPEESSGEGDKKLGSTEPTIPGPALKKKSKGKLKVKAKSKTGGERKSDSNLGVKKANLAIKKKKGTQLKSIANKMVRAIDVLAEDDDDDVFLNASVTNQQSVQGDDSDTEPEDGCETTQIKVDDEITLNFSKDAFSKSASSTAKPKEQKKSKPTKTKAASAVTKKLDVKKPKLEAKKKFVSVRKGRSGTKTRSTGAQL